MLLKIPVGEKINKPSFSKILGARLLEKEK